MFASRWWVAQIEANVRREWDLRTTYDLCTSNSYIPWLLPRAVKRRSVFDTHSMHGSVFRSFIDI